MGVVKYTGPVASFHCPTNAEIRSLKVHFSPKQEGSGDPSPENVRPIEGWDGVEAYHIGKNMISTNENDWEQGQIMTSGRRTNSTDGNYLRRIRTINKYPILPNTQYTLSWFGDIVPAFHQWEKDKTTYISDSGWKTNANKIFTFTSNNNAYWIEFTCRRNDNSALISPSVVGTEVSIQLEEGQIPTSYEPYQGFTTDYKFGVLGKNKFDYTDSNNWRYANTATNRLKTKPTNVDISIDNNVVTLNRNAERWGYSFILGNLVKGTSYCLSGNFSNIDGKAYIAKLDSETIQDNYTCTRLFTLTFTDNQVAFTPTENGIYELLMWNSGTDSISVSNIQLELGSTATAYEPYDPKHTVYGGWVDLISGEVCEEWHKMVIDTTSRIGLFPWGGVKTDATTETEYATALFRRESTDPKAYTIKDNLCDKLPMSTNNNKINVAYVYDGDSYGPAISLPTSIIGTTNETLIEYLTDNPFTFVYKQRVPNTYHLAPIALQTFLSHNNVWSNADYVEVEYDLHETQDILARKQFIIANQPHVEKLAAAPLQNFVTDMVAPIKECKVHFEPKQDLNGYSKPWVGGAGKNLFNATTSTPKKYIDSSGNINFSYDWSASDFIKAKAETTYALTAPASAGSNTARIAFYDSNQNLISTFGAQEVEANNNIFTTPANTAYIRISVRTETPTDVQLEVGSAATDYEPYENICPIEGFNNIQLGLPDEYQKVEYLESTGAQYFWTDVPVQDGLTVESIQTFADGNDSYLFGGAANENNERTCFNGMYNSHIQGAYPKDYYNSAKSLSYDTIYTVKTTHINHTITIYVDDVLFCTINRTGIVPETGAKCICFGARRSDGTVLGGRYLYRGKVYSIIVSKNNKILANYIPCRRKADNKPGMYDTITKIFYINEGSDEFICGPDIEEQSLLVDWTDEAGTIYGGYVDLITGELVQEYGSQILNGTEGWIRQSQNQSNPNSQYNPIYLTATNPKTSMNDSLQKGITNYIPEYTTITDLRQDGILCCRFGWGDTSFYLCNVEQFITDIIDITTLKQYLSEHPLTIVYKLKEPIIHQLTPTQLKTLRGQNNIWSNSNGNITVQFWRH